MKLTFLGQGFSADIDKSVGQQLINLFSENTYQVFTGISAFASEAGVNGLANCILSSRSFESFNLVVGIDQDGTSKEALEEIFNLKINSFIFYQKENPIFHPKIYLFEGKQKSTIIVGSSNLTGRGLFENVESSIMLEFDSDDAEGQGFLGELKEYYKTLFDFSDRNLFPITHEVIADFVAKGIVPPKKIWIEQQRKKSGKKSSESDEIIIPRRETAKTPEAFRGKSKNKEFLEAILDETEDSSTYIKIDVEGDEKITTEALILPTNALVARGAVRTEVWKSKPLVRRDLNIPLDSHTSKTGSMFFKKGMKEGIDQKHYFRDTVFSNLNWEPRKNRRFSHVHKAHGKFNIEIGGVNYGDYVLGLNHDSATDTPAYKQNNSMTSLSWGDAKSLIEKEELLGKTLTLYKDYESDNYFFIKIS